MKHMVQLEYKAAAEWRPQKLGDVCSQSAMNTAGEPPSHLTPLGEGTAPLSSPAPPVALVPSTLTVLVSRDAETHEGQAANGPLEWCVFSNTFFLFYI